jgi:Ca-activated chloride channel family protein
MQFKNPYFFLLFIPLIIISVFSYIYREKRLYNIRFPFTPKRIRTLKLSLYESLPFYMRIIAISLLIIALSRPQEISRDTLPPTEGVDIMLVLDTSTSMAALDFEPKNRIEAAKETAIDFISKRNYDRIGLVVFGGVAVLSCPLTLDHNSAIEYISQVYLAMTQSDGTAIGDAIVTAVNHLKDSKAKSKLMILLTDGRSNTGVLQDVSQAAKIAKEFGIKIYTIGVAKKGKAKVPTGDPFQPYFYIDDDLNEADLMTIAKITDGKFYRATNMIELQNIYSEIDKLEKTKFETKVSGNYKDLYNYFLIPAIFIYILIIIMEKTVFLTVP